MIASLHEAPASAIRAPERDEEFDLSADWLLNQTVVETRYDQLGPETLNGRSTTKYRVLPQLEARAAAGAQETLIWVEWGQRSKNSSQVGDKSNVRREADQHSYGVVRD